MLCDLIDSSKVAFQGQNFDESLFTYSDSMKTDFLVVGSLIRSPVPDLEILLEVHVNLNFLLECGLPQKFPTYGPRLTNT